MLQDVLADEANSNSAVLVSSLGHVFILGDVEDFEIIEVDDNHEQYVITDAGDTERTILFHGDASDYGILICQHGIAKSTTGIGYASDDDKDYKEFVDMEVGTTGQDCDTKHDEMNREDVDE